MAASATPAPTPTASGRRITAIVAIILISYFMILLDNSIIVTALPKIQAALHFSSSGLAWVQDVYTLHAGGGGCDHDPLAAGVVLLAVLVFTERRVVQPLLPLRMFASRQRAGADVARLLYLGAMIGFFYFTTQYLQNVLGFTAFKAGVAFFSMTAVNFIVAVAIPRITRGPGQAPSLVADIALTLAGMC